MEQDFFKKSKIGPCTCMGIIETGYCGIGFLWKSKSGSCACMFLWRRVMNTVEKKSELDPVHLLYFRDRIWI